MEVNFTLDTIDAAAIRFLTLTANHKVVALHGEMGAGKTTFVHAVCKALGITDATSSPTYAIINEYNLQTAETVYHIDLYRLKDAAEIIEVGVEDCLYSGNYCFVEWPEKALTIFPENTLHVYITLSDNGSRKLTIKL